MEIWKAIKNYEGLYEVSDLGKVKGLDRKTVHMGRRITIKEKILKTRVNNSGYMEVRLSKDGKTSTKFIHILKAQSFIPNPEGKKEVNHKDGNKLNNENSNLEWVTHGENIKHAYRLGLCKVANKAKIVINISTRVHFRSIREAAEFYSIPYSTCKNFLSGKRKNPTTLEYLPVKSVA